MNLQIYGTKKCFDTKKAERFFKERRIKYQYIDIIQYGISMGVLKKLEAAIGFEELVNTKDVDYPVFKYLALKEDKLNMLFETPYLLNTPIVRCEKGATVGYKPELWNNWIK